MPRRLPCPPISDTPTVAGRSDDTLLRCYQSGDDGAATALYLRYASRLRGLARHYCSPSYAGRFDADDIVQSVFRTFFQHARQQSYEVPPGGELWGLLMVLALNKVRNLIRYHRAGKRAVQQTASSYDLDQHPAMTEDRSAAEFLKLILDEQLAGLPESNRNIVRLRTEGCDINEIAEQTGRSRRTVERVLQEFRDRLARS